MHGSRSRHGPRTPGGHHGRLCGGHYRFTGYLPTTLPTQTRTHALQMCLLSVTDSSSTPTHTLYTRTYRWLSKLQDSSASAPLVPVRFIAWKCASPKWPIMGRVPCWPFNSFAALGDYSRQDALSAVGDDSRRIFTNVTGNSLFSNFYPQKPSTRSQKIGSERVKRLLTG